MSKLRTHLAPQILPLADEIRPVLSTAELAFHTGLTEKCWRTHAANGTGPLRPLRILGQLRWPTDQVRGLVGLPTITQAATPEEKEHAVSAQRNVPHLRRTIGAYLGHELTPDIALAIEQAAHHVDDNSIDPAQFEPLAIDGLTIQAERFRDIVDELQALGFLEGPDGAVESLRFDELQGRLLQFTVRRGSALVGHLRFFVAVSRHTGVLMARADTQQLMPTEADRTMGLTLMRYAEKCLLQIGVRHIEADSTLIDGADKLMEEMAYPAVAIKFTKTFAEAP